MTTPIKTAEISTQLKATLLGAGLGGAVGGLGDWLLRDKNNPDSSWDGILSGAALGGYLGNRGATLGGYPGQRESAPAKNRDNSSAGAAKPGATATLSSQLPPGYRAEAKSLAEAYRKLHPDIDWKERITDKALDRKVPVDYGNVSGSISNSLAAKASYNPNTDRIQLKDPSDTLALPHELTHAAQTHSSIREDAERLARQGRPTYTKAVSQLSPKAPQQAIEEANYLTDPQEEEAYLADIKRKFYQGTGQQVRTPEEARAALDWRMRTIRHGEELPLLDARLHQSRRNSKLQEPREEWIKALTQRMPGLVQNDGYDLSKTATFSGGNAMTPSMGGLDKQAFAALGLSKDLTKGLGRTILSYGDDILNRGKGLIKNLTNRRALPGPVIRNTAQGPVASLADQLPRGYLVGAQSAAQAYRKQNPDKTWVSDISDRAVNRQVPVNYVSNKDYRGQYSATADEVRLNPTAEFMAGPKGQGSVLRHELVHGTQYLDGKLPARVNPELQPAAEQVLTALNYPKPAAYGQYLTRPTEQEAQLATLKQDHFARTGKHITTQQQAKNFLEQFPNTPKDEATDGNIGELLRRAQQRNAFGEYPNKSDVNARSEWLHELSKTLPGLVQTNSLDLSKTANFPGGNAMTPTPNMGGFMGGMPAGNNFSRTFQPGMPPMPQKPNPLAAAAPVQSMKADTNGIQTAMAKRGSQDNSAKRISATGESDGVGYKLDDDGHTTGGSAFGTLDKYMKKAGLNSFQAQFFGRMIQAGLDETQIQQAVKLARVQFGPQVAQELADGLEKLAFNAALMAGAGRAVRGGINFARGLTGTKSLVDAATKLNMGAKASRQASPAFATGQKINLGAQQLLNPMMQPARKVVDAVTKNKDVVQGLTTGAFNPYTGLMSNTAQNEDGSTNFGKVLGSTVLGGLAGKGLGKTQFADAARRVQRQSLAGSNLVSGTGMVANLAGSDVDTTRAAQLAGLGAAFLPRKLTAIPGVSNLVKNVKVPAGIRSALAGHTDEALDALRPDNFIANQVRNVGNAGRKAVENYADGIPVFPGGRQAATDMAQRAAQTIGDKYKAVAPAVQAQYAAVKPTLDNARNFVTNNPAKTIGAGLGGTALAAGAYGATQIPGAIERGIGNAGTKMLQSPEIQQRLQGMDDIMGRGHAMLNQGQQTLSNVNSAVSPFVGQGGQSNLLGGMMSSLGLGGEGSLGSRISGFMKENPEMATRGLLSLLGAGGGYMAGGGQGAALGGLSLPLMHYLAQQYGGGMPDYFGSNSRDDGTSDEDNAAPAVTPQAQAAVVPQENEIQRQQQQINA